jgi:hypothetical protein
MSTEKAEQSNLDGRIGQRLSVCPAACAVRFSPWRLCLFGFVPSHSCGEKVELLGPTPCLSYVMSLNSGPVTENKQIKR